MTGRPGEDGARPVRRKLAGPLDHGPQAGHRLETARATAAAAAPGIADPRVPDLAGPRVVAGIEPAADDDAGADALADLDDDHRREGVVLSEGPFGHGRGLRIVDHHDGQAGEPAESLAEGHVAPVQADGPEHRARDRVDEPRRADADAHERLAGSLHEVGDQRVELGKGGGTVLTSQVPCGPCPDLAAEVHDGSVQTVAVDVDTDDVPGIRWHLQQDRRLPARGTTRAGLDHELVGDEAIDHVGHGRARQPRDARDVSAADGPLLVDRPQRESLVRPAGVLVRGLLEDGARHRPRSSADIDRRMVAHFVKSVDKVR